jgi:hypothetical protein
MAGSAAGLAARQDVDVGRSGTGATHRLAHEHPRCGWNRMIDVLIIGDAGSQFFITPG